MWLVTSYDGRSLLVLPYPRFTHLYSKGTLVHGIIISPIIRSLNVLRFWFFSSDIIYLILLKIQEKLLDLHISMVKSV
jgi:hypothetical protein